MRPPERRSVASQDPGADRVERTGPHASGLCSQEGRDPVPHLARGLVREGDREDSIGGNTVLVDELCDANGKHSGLARPGPRQDEQGSLKVCNGLSLLLIEGLVI